MPSCFKQNQNEKLVGAQNQGSDVIESENEETPSSNDSQQSNSKQDISTIEDETSDNIET